jgi:hypothetical protein
MDETQTPRRALRGMRKGGRLPSAIFAASSFVLDSFASAWTDAGILPWSSISATNEPQAGTKQCRTIQTCKDKNHFSLSPAHVL